MSATNDSGLVDFVKVLRGSIIRLVDESARGGWQRQINPLETMGCFVK